MSKYEKIIPERGRKAPLAGLAVRVAVPADAPGIAAISAERYAKPAERFEGKVRRELDGSGTGGPKIFVAETEDGIVGFARCKYMDTVAEPVKYPAPSGWYGLGIIVRSAFRGRGVARVLSDFRAAWLRDEARAECLYSFVSFENPVSQKMHADLGFEAVSEGPGFLDVAFDCGRGILYRLSLK